MGMPYAEWRKLRAVVILAHLRKHGLRCGGAPDHPAHPVRSVRDLTVDHIIPRSRGGTNARRNLRVMCAKENYRKGGKMIDYRSEMRIRKPAKAEEQVPAKAAMKVVRVPADRAYPTKKPNKGEADGPVKGT